MDEYIKRKAALAKMNYLFRTYAFSGILTKKMRESLRAIPAADVVEVRHGQFVFGETMNHAWMKCSVCNNSLEPDGTFSFCPYCGAKMDLEATT